VIAAKASTIAVVGFFVWLALAGVVGFVAAQVIAEGDIDCDDLPDDLDDELAELLGEEA
jgi:hypothetical protein